MGSSPGADLSKKRKIKRHRAPFERRVNRFAFFLVTPALIVSAVLIWQQPWSLGSKLLLFGSEVIACLLIGLGLHDHVVRPLQTLANVVGALRDEDYSFRARLAVPNDALGELSLEVNALADLLAQHRDDAVAALAVYEAARLPRTARIQLHARERGKINNTTSAFARFKRDLGYRLKRLIKPNEHTYKIEWIYGHDVTAARSETSAAA
ncbi:MAG TPA: hypothetical protein VIG91_08795 [Terriglobales bacterium]